MHGYRGIVPLDGGDASDVHHLVEFNQAAGSFDTPGGRTYHPPDDDAPCAFWRPARLRAFRGK
jgi:hypothetical protein